MDRSEKQTSIELIEPALINAGWTLRNEVRLGSESINAHGSQHTHRAPDYIDFMLSFRGITLAVLEIKAEFISAAEGMQQASLYAGILYLRYSIATNGHDWIVTDNKTGEFEVLSYPPSPQVIIARYGMKINWPYWEVVFNSSYYGDWPLPIHQEMAVNNTLTQFAGGNRRTQISIANGAGRSHAILQLVWRYLKENKASRRILFLTDRNVLNEQLFHMFQFFPESQRYLFGKSTFLNPPPDNGKLYFATLQRMMYTESGVSLYETFNHDFFDLIILNDSSVNLTGNIISLLDFFSGAFQLRVTAETNFAHEKIFGHPLPEHTEDYFGAPAFVYTSEQATDDGYLVPSRIVRRIAAKNGNGYTNEVRQRPFVTDTLNIIDTLSRTREIAEDLWSMLVDEGVQDEKTVIFCSNVTHAALMVIELQRLSESLSYAANFTGNQQNLHEIHRSFSGIGKHHPRVIVTVEMYTGLDVPDIKNLVFARQIQSSIQYRRMKNIGSRPCPSIGKTHFSVFDYTGASLLDENDPYYASRFSLQKNNDYIAPRFPERGKRTYLDSEMFQQTGLSITDKVITLPEGQTLTYQEYLYHAGAIILSKCHSNVKELYRTWVDRTHRQSLRNHLRMRFVDIPLLAHLLKLSDTDEVDVLAKVAFHLPAVPTRTERVEQIWDVDHEWLTVNWSDPEAAQLYDFKIRIWQAGLGHYIHTNIDELEKARTYDSPLFVELFGGFVEIVRKYGGPREFRTDLEQVKQRLYNPVA